MNETVDGVKTKPLNRKDPSSPHSTLSEKDSLHNLSKNLMNSQTQLQIHFS
jgi:hypothetical protein